MVKSSLIISTYNWPEALELVLLSVKAQTVYPTEVIIADDGSTDETKSLIEKFKLDFPIPLIHVWHEDKGFRKSIILNKSINRAIGDYIIEVDGDCILHKSFVKDHLNSLEESTYLYGSRANLQQGVLNNLFSEKKITFGYFEKGLKKKNRTIHLPLLGGLLYRKRHNLSAKVRGCNMSFWKSDFLRVNGYNEDMIGWGREDSELIVRMLNNGVYGKRLKFKAIVYHIFHIEKSKDRLDINDVIQNEAIKNKLTWCKNGVDKYLNEA